MVESRYGLSYPRVMEHGRLYGCCLKISPKQVRTLKRKVLAINLGQTAAKLIILEHWGKDQNHAQSAIHTRSSHGNTVNLGGQVIPTISSEFHVYALDWSAAKLVFAVDGDNHYTYAPAVKNKHTWPFDRDYYLLLNFAIEKDIDSAFEQGHLSIDYVRIYDQENNLIWSDEFN